MRWAYGMSIVLWWGVLGATVYTVTSSADDGSTGTLRWAITQANNHPGMDTIYFAISNDTLQLTDTLPRIQSPLLIDGQNHHIALDGSNASRVFQVDLGGNLVPLQIRHLSLIRLSGYGLRVVMQSTPEQDSIVIELRGLYISSPQTGTYAVFVSNYGIVRITIDSTVIDTFSGTGIYVYNNNVSATERLHLLLRDATIRNCGGYGILGAGWRDNRPVYLRILRCLLENNGNADYEAAVYARNEVRLYMNRVHLRQNATQIYLDANGYSQYDTLIACRVDTASVGGRRGILVSQNSSTDSLVLYMYGDTVRSTNSATSYGLQILRAVSPTWIHIHSCLFEGGYGFAVPDLGSNTITTLDSVLVEDSRFVNGTYGIYLTHDGADRLEVRRCVISGHQYHGVYVNGDIDSLTFVNDTIVNNGISGSEGDGVFLADSAADFNSFSRCIVRGNLGLAYHWVSGANEGWNHADGQVPSVLSYTVYRTAGVVDSVVIVGSDAPALGQVEAYFVDTLDVDPSGYGELTGFLGGSAADASGNFRIVVLAPMPAGWDTTDRVSVIAHTPGGSTSEASATVTPILVQETRPVPRTPGWIVTTGLEVALLRPFPGEPARLEVYTPQGQRIYTLEIPAQQVRVSMPPLPSGIYLLRLHTPHGVVLRKALVLR